MSVHAVRGIRSAAWAAALAVVGIVMACGEVPTLAGGIAYISAVIPPAPAIAINDTLRDSLGRVAPLQVFAFDRDNNVIGGVTATYVVTAAPTGVSVSAAGIVTAKDSTGSLRLVARIGESLQTGEIVIPVVAPADSMARSGATVRDSIAAPDSISPPISVLVTGLRNGTRVPVQGIIVRYQITSLFPAGSADSARFRLLDDSNMSLRSDPRMAVDTTGTDGIAARKLKAIPTTGTDSVRVTISAKSLRGLPLRGSPILVSIPIR